LIGTTEVTPPYMKLVLFADCEASPAGRVAAALRARIGLDTTGSTFTKRLGRANPAYNSGIISAKEGGRLRVPLRPIRGRDGRSAEQSYRCASRRPILAGPNKRRAAPPGTLGWLAASYFE
jgi:hypothetical protein